MIEKAMKYLEQIMEKEGRAITDDDKNNAANIFSASYGEYIAIWEAINE